MKSSWWKLTIEDYPNYKPSDVDLEHIAEMIKQGYDNGQLIQEKDQLKELLKNYSSDTLIDIIMKESNNKERK